MSLQSLFIHTLDHYQASHHTSPAGGDVNGYPSSPSESSIPCRLQAMDAREIVQYSREDRIPSHRCYLAAGRTFSATDRVKISGTFYDVVTADSPIESGRPQKLLLERSTVQ